MESRGILELIDGVKRGDSRAFIELIRKVESLCLYSLRTTRQVWFGNDLVLVHNCTYILVDKRERQAYVLARFYDTYTVLRFDINPDVNVQELCESICIYLESTE